MIRMWSRTIQSRCFRPALSFLIGAALLLAGAPLVPAQPKVKPKNLASQYQEWIKLTSYVITDKEMDVFLHLTNDRDRDLFIDAFWKLRDPTPATPQNEYKDEHIKRFREANRQFRFGSAREGWMTDRGRISIILGPPVSREYDAGSNDLYPTEIWSYYGDVEKGMPVHFELVFFQYRNAGEMKLYDPLSDGPARLLVKGTEEYSPTDYQSMYNKIVDIRPDLAAVCLSIIPYDTAPGFQPNLESAIYMAAILESPKKGLNDSYATHFLNFKGYVSTEYLTNFMSSEGIVAVIRDPATGLDFCDFAVSPERLSVDFYEPKNEYSSNFQIDVSLRADDKIILQYSKEYPLTIPESQLADTKSMGIAIADSFPVIPGSYKLTVLLLNTVGKEFSVLERDVNVPAAAGAPRLMGPILGVKLTDAQPGAHMPFQAMARKLNVDPKNTYSPSDQIAYMFNVIGLTQELWKDGVAGITLSGKDAAAPFQKALTIPLNSQPFHPDLVIAQVIPAADIPPDYYELTLTLKDSRGNILDHQTGNFIISPAKSIAHPVVASKAIAVANSFMFYYMLAAQYDQTGHAGLADVAYQKALSLNPGYTQKIPDYALFLLKEKRPGEALALIERINADSRLKFQYYLLKGRALQALERWDEAILNFTEGNRMYDSDAGLLAGLGACYYKTGQAEKARNALQASLKLNPEQEAVKKLLREIEAKK